jgi:hypothetical protein
MNKIKWLTILFLIVSFLIPYQTVFADNDDFDTDISMTENSETHCYEIDIEVYNSGKNFTGRMELQISSGGYYANASTYIASVSIPEKSTKVVHFSVPVAVSTDPSFNVNIAIKNEKDKVVHDNMFNNPLKNANSYFNVGILSNSPDNLSYLDLGGQKIWITTGEFSIRHTTLKASTLAEQLYGLNAVIISDYDSSTLTQDEKNAIENWVRGGGVLYICTGYDLNTLKGFDSSFTGVTGSNGKYEGFIANTADGVQVTSQDLDVTYLNGQIFYTNYGSLGYIQNNGTGAVVTLSFDLADKNIKAEDKSYLEGMVSSLYDAGIQNTGFITDKGEVIFSSYTGFSEYMQKPVNNTMGFIVPIIIIYIFLVGPGVYFFLKKIGKREKCWVVIPCVSLVFTLFIFLLSFSIAVKKMNMDTLTIREAGSGNIITFAEGYSPKTDTWEIGLDERYFTGYANERYHSGTAGAKFVSSPTGVRLVYSPDSAFDESSFIFYGKDDRIGNFDEIDKITCDSIQVTGTFTNNTGYDFDYVAIMYENCITVTKAVKNGETIDIQSRTFFNDNSGSPSNVFRRQCDKMYYQGEYDEAAKMSALGLAADAVVFAPAKDYKYHPIILGVTESKDVLDMKNGDESAFTCIYMD